MAVHKVEKTNQGNFRVFQKRTIKDINGVDFEILDSVHELQESHIQAEIQNYENQKLNADLHIARLQNILLEIDKVK